MENLGHAFRVEDIVNKMKKLRQKYKNEKDKAKRSGTGKRKPWKFFAKMDCILGYRPNIQPPFLLDSSAECSAVNGSDDDDGPMCKL